MTRTSNPQRALQQLPKKWAVAIVLTLIVYAVAQPLANHRWGWHLPSLASWLGMETSAPSGSLAPPPQTRQAEHEPAAETAAKPAAKTPPKSAEPTQQELAEQDSKAGLNKKSPDRVVQTKDAPPTMAESQAESATSVNSNRDTQSKNSPAAEASLSDDNLLYGLLKDSGREVYISPAGLRYTRGSEEGHRLKHLERHLTDIPDRPGKHGVFDGDMAQALRWIDDAYMRGQRGAKGVRQRDEDGRTVYEVPFSRPIGYIGGRDGKRDRNPESKRLRLIVDGNQVITAFPY